jgi:acetylornithine deacetylase/succinyl-diaminopimelate desuccinylase-like protein
VNGGSKRNVLPQQVELHLDVRVVPGQDRDEVESAMRGLVEGLDCVDIEFPKWRQPSRSERYTPLWTALEEVCAELMPGARIIPSITAAATDGRHVRPFGSPCYGFGLFSEVIDAEEYFRMFHNTNERIDQDSLVLLCRLWIALAVNMLS